MSTLRILTNNAADKATITVSGAAAGMGADKLKTDIKGEVCRVLSSSAAITIDWPAPEEVGCVVIPASNLSPTSTIRVRTYSDAAGAVLLQDSGVKAAAPGSAQQSLDFTQPLNVNQFAEGVAPITACYLARQELVRKVIIDLNSPGASFIDLARLLIGAVHTPRYGAGYGALVGVQDMTRNSRAASGDLKSDWGPKAATLQFDLAWIDEDDRDFVQRLIWRGTGRCLFVSLLAECEDGAKERAHSIYGRPVQPAALAYASFGLYSANMTIESF